MVHEGVGNVLIWGEFHVVFVVSLITNQSAEEAATACRQTSEKIRAAIIFFIKKSFFFSTEILYYQSILFLQPSAEIFYYASFDVESNFI